ncbi:MAG: class I SAM-dependent methyltransferase [Thermoleophilia bacterium]
MAGEDRAAVGARELVRAPRKLGQEGKSMMAGRRDGDVDRFGRWAASYNESVLQRVLFAPLQELTLREAASLLPHPRAILDIGCGTGLLLRRAVRRFPSSELTGVDAADEMIRVAQASVPEGVPVRFVHAFAEDLPFAAASFDLVLTTMSFHHWANQAKALGEVRRVLIPGGVCALTDTLSAGWFRWLFTWRGHGRFNSPSALEGLLRDAGLPVDRFVPVTRFGGTVQVVLARAAAL